MPVYEIETLEYFETKATYTVEAISPRAAKHLVVSGKVAYDRHDHPGNDDRFGEILSCVLIDDERGSASALFLALVLLVILLVIGSGVIIPVATMTP